MAPVELESLGRHLAGTGEYSRPASDRSKLILHL